MEVTTVAGVKNHLLVIARTLHSVSTNLYVSSLNQDGQLGLGDFCDCHCHELTMVPGLKHVEQVAAGAFHSLALSRGAKYLYAFGKADDGALGLGFEHNQKCERRCHTPTLVSFIADEPVLLSSIACGDSHSMAISIRGDLYTWDFNVLGQTGQTEVARVKTITFGDPQN